MFLTKLEIIIPEYTNFPYLFNNLHYAVSQIEKTKQKNQSILNKTKKIITPEYINFLYLFNISINFIQNVSIICIPSPTIVTTHCVHTDLEAVQT